MSPQRTSAEKPAKKFFAAFTLAELIVVITILAILATIGFLALSGYSQDAKESATKANVRSIQTAISSESAVTGNSARYYIVHDTWASLSGAFVYVDGTQNALTGWNWNDSWTNYSAGNPDYARLKLNAEKFKSAFLPKVITDAYSYDAKRITVGAVDLVSAQAGAKRRSVSYFQVAGVVPATGKVVLTGNYPTDSANSVAGLIKLPTSASTGALVEGWTLDSSTFPIGASCGASNTVATLAYPSSSLCAPWTASGTDLTWTDGAFNWTCLGSNGWANANCSAPKNYHSNCSAILLADSLSPSWNYTIDPDGNGGNAPFQVACDMVTDGGGWIVLDSKFTDYTTWTNCTSGYGSVSASWLWQVSAENGGGVSGVHGGCGIQWRNSKAIPFRYMKVKTFSSPSNVSCGSVLFPNVIVGIVSSDAPATSFSTGNYYPGWYAEGTNVAYKTSGQRASWYAANDTYDAASVGAWGVHLGSGKYSTCWGVGSGYVMIK